MPGIRSLAARSAWRVHQAGMHVRLPCWTCSLRRSWLPVLAPRRSHLQPASKVADSASKRAGGGDAYQPLQQPAEGLDAVCTEVLGMVPAEPRAVGPSFLFAIDHCFPIKGQGTVFTGTVLQARLCCSCNGQPW